MQGAGTLNFGKQRLSFAFDVRDTKKFGDRGSLVLRLKDLKRRSDRWGVGSVVDARFSKADRTVRFTATGSWHGKRGHRFEVTATDSGSKRGHHDRFAVVIKAPNGKVVESVSGVISDGDIRFR
jgi:hypothetical protein